MCVGAGRHSVSRDTAISRARQSSKDGRIGSSVTRDTKAHGGNLGYASCFIVVRSSRGEREKKIDGGPAGCEPGFRICGLTYPCLASPIGSAGANEFPQYGQKTSPGRIACWQREQCELKFSPHRGQ